MMTIVAPGFLSNDIDPDGDDIFAISLASPPSNGALNALVDGSFTYDPDPGFTGTDTFTYIIRDTEFNQSEPGVVVIEVLAPNTPPVAQAADLIVECTGPAGTFVLLDGSGSAALEVDMPQYTWYEDGMIIAGPSTSPTAEVVLPAGVHLVTLMVEDMCGRTSSDNAVILVDDTTPPTVEAELIATGMANEYQVHCSAEDICTENISTISLIRIPDLADPSVNLLNQPNYSLKIFPETNTVQVKAPDAAAFWNMIQTLGGVPVAEGQVIVAKYDKNKYKFSFDREGKLTSVEGEIVTLRCIATDENGNSGMDDFILSMDNMRLAVSDGEAENWHQNSPNPFRDQTTIRYQLHESGPVRITVWDQTGAMVDELFYGVLPAGKHETTWNAQALPSGIYFYSIEHEGSPVTGRMIHIMR